MMVYNFVEFVLMLLMAMACFMMMNHSCWFFPFCNDAMELCLDGADEL